MMRTIVWMARNVWRAPLSRANWYKKAVLWPVVVCIGFPLYGLAFCLAVLPLLLGGGLLFLQTYLYLQEGNWYSLSVLDVATHTVDRRLANEIGEPLLASCEGLRGMLTPGGGGALLRKPCAGLSPWQLWLFEPHSWLGLHEVLLPLLNLASIALLSLLTGQFLWHGFKSLRSSDPLEAVDPVKTGIIQPHHR